MKITSTRTQPDGTTVPITRWQAFWMTQSIAWQILLKWNTAARIDDHNKPEPGSFSDLPGYEP